MKHGDHTLPDKGSNHQQDLEKVTDLFRKLREAIFATKWANGDLEFSVQGTLSDLRNSQIHL